MFVQGTGAANANSTLGRSLSLTVAAGNSLTVWGVAQGPSDPTMTISSSPVVTFTAKTEVFEAGGHTRSRIWVAENVPAGSITITITPSATAFISMVAAEFTTILDNESTGGPTTGTNATTGSVPVSGTDDLFGVMTHTAVGNPVLTPGAGFTQIAEVENTTNMPFNAVYQSGVSSATPVSWTHVSVTGWQAEAVSLKVSLIPCVAAIPIGMFDPDLNPLAAFDPDLLMLFDSDFVGPATITSYDSRTNSFFLSL